MTGPLLIPNSSLANLEPTKTDSSLRISPFKSILAKSSPAMNAKDSAGENLTFHTFCVDKN